MYRPDCHWYCTPFQYQCPGSHTKVGDGAGGGVSASGGGGGLGARPAVDEDGGGGAGGVTADG
jgi:hypothetical protein